MKTNFFLISSIIICLYLANYLEASLKEKKTLLYPKTEVSLEKTEEPEQVIGSIMLGGFRVFISDLLWLKMVTLEETGETHELIMTANLISTLQPTYTSVWEYLGFVLSNNVSTNETDPQLKLEWVKSALDYLYKGIKRNPDSGMLYVAMGRTINEKLGINKERLLNHYFTLREEGSNPHEMARDCLKEAIKTNNYTVYAERELFIANAYWVSESIFHIRNITKKHCLLAQAILNGEKEDILSKISHDYEDYNRKFGAEGTLKEVSKRISEAVETIRLNTIKYPNQVDFQMAYDTHSQEYTHRYAVASSLIGYNAEMEILVKNGKQNYSEEALTIALLEIEIILSRIKILESEFMDDYLKIRMACLNDIHERILKINKIKESKSSDESKK